MTYQADFPVPSDILEQFASGGWEFPPELIRIVVNVPMRQERQQHLRVSTGSKSSKQTRGPDCIQNLDRP